MGIDRPRNPSHHDLKVLRGVCYGEGPAYGRSASLVTKLSMRMAEAERLMSPNVGQVRPATDRAELSARQFHSTAKDDHANVAPHAKREYER